MDISIPSNSTMGWIAERIHGTYVDLGASAAIAKSRSFTQKLREQFGH